MEPFKNWRELNYKHGLLRPDDCVNCCGSGRVPYRYDEYGARYKNCLECNGSGKRTIDNQYQVIRITIGYNLYQVSYE